MWSMVWRGVVQKPSALSGLMCERCGAVDVLSELHTPLDALTIREIIAHMRHDATAGRAHASEAASLKVGNVDSSRMVMRIDASDNYFEYVHILKSHNRSPLGP